MRSVDEFAQFFLNKNLDDTPNTFDGNMKLQKLLFFSNLINLAENNELLFKEKMYAFKNGTVIEEVRLRYRNDYYAYRQQADTNAYSFNDHETEVINKTINIFGKLSAKELSNLNHEFDFWKENFARSINEQHYYVKENSEISEDELRKEVYKIDRILQAYGKVNKNCEIAAKETINGITFYYNPKEVKDINKLVSELEQFSSEADDTSYNVYFDEEEMVIL